MPMEYAYVLNQSNVKMCITNEVYSQEIYLISVFCVKNLTHEKIVPSKIACLLIQIGFLYKRCVKMY